MKDNEALKIFTLRVLSRLKFPQNGYFRARAQTTFCTKIVSTHRSKSTKGRKWWTVAELYSEQSGNQAITLSFGSDFSLERSDTEELQVPSQVPGKVAKPDESTLM